MSKWTHNNIPDQTGKIIVITGANSGLGYESSLALARKNAHVIMAIRNLSKGEAAKTQILAQVPNANVELMQLDLGSLDSVREFAAAYTAKYDKLDVLMNNAGIMAVPQGKTADGFEKQFGVNHLGHFALTGLLYDVLTRTPNSRVVNVSSVAHRQGEMNFDDLMHENDYRPWRVYSQSKLSNLLFTFELQRKFERNGAATLSIAAHPGYSATDLQKMGGDETSLLMRVMNTLLAQSAEQGALPQLYAATEPTAQGGTYIGPDGFQAMRGYPTIETPTDAARNEADAKRLWQESEQLTGITYPEAVPA